jgi:hypothetical protein
MAKHVQVECGTDNTISKVEEPSKCVYTMRSVMSDAFGLLVAPFYPNPPGRFATPAACTHADAKVRTLDTFEDN